MTTEWTQETLFNEARKLARKTFNKLGEHVPMFLIEHPSHGLGVMPTPWESAAMKG